LVMIRGGCLTVSYEAFHKLRVLSRFAAFAQPSHNIISQRNEAVIVTREHWMMYRLGISSFTGLGM
jgi:hypothetical protein